MKIQSSYIFFENVYNTDLNNDNYNFDGKIVLGLEMNVISFIRKSFPEIELEKNSEHLFKKKFTLKFKKDVNTFLVAFFLHHVVGITYLDICVEGNRKKQIVECLEEIQNTLIHSGIRAYYIDIISYDAISEYYCEKLYKHFNTLERNLRKLFFNIYVLNFGGHFYGDTIDKSLREHSKSIIKQDTKSLKAEYKKEYCCANNNDLEEIIIIKRLFYSFSYGDIKTFLFTPIWSDYDKNKILKQYNDLTALSDTELREIIDSISPQSNWDRFFSENLVINDIEKVIDSIREYRNTVAHFKFLSKNDYSNCLKEVCEFNKAVIKAIKLTEDKDFDKKNMEHIREMWAPILDTFSEVVSGIAKKINERFQSFMQSHAFTNLQKIVKKLGDIAISETLEMQTEDDDEEEQDMLEY